MYVNYKKFDAEKLTFEKEDDKKFTYMAKYGTEPFRLKTPKVIAVSNVDEADDLVTLEVELNSKTLIHAFESIDDKIIDFVSKEFDTLPFAVQGYFVPSLRRRNFLRFRIPFKDDGVATEIYDNKDKLIDLEKYSYKNLIKKDDILELVLELPEIRVLNKKIVKCNYYVTHMKINKKISNSLFEDSDTDRDEDDDGDEDD